MIRSALTLLVVVALPAQVVRTIVANGPTNNRYDVVILGDGYQASEQARFDSDCVTFAAALFNKEPYKTFGRYFNVHTVYRASNESGADHPDVNPPIYRDTVYGATYNTGGTARCLYITNTSLALADAALAPANEGRVLVMVNDSRYGGCAGQFAVSYNGSSMNEVQIHEMGHSVGGLADEYWYTGQVYSGPEPAQVNATIDTAGSKWSHWLGSNGIGVFQGCRYSEFGLYRPLNDCLMRSLGRGLCSVCSEALVLRAHGSATAIDQPQPPETTVTLGQNGSQVFSFTNIAPITSNVVITWKLDGNQVATGTTTHTLQASGLSLGTHVLRVELLDRTALVRRDPSNLLRQAREWTVRVTVPAPDLVVDAFAPSASTITAGTDIALATTVRNVGTSSAGAHEVAHFLSLDQNISSGDVFLGRSAVPALASNASTVNNRPAVRIPAFVAPGTYWLAAWVDYDNTVPETEEGNNLRLVQVRIDPPACGTALEYRDLLLYPKDRAVVSYSQTIPNALPTVTSRCHAGKQYLLVWGCSGTSPGTPIAGRVLPLNLDACSNLSLGWRGPFATFVGNLDSQGVGRPSFVLLGVPYVGDIPGHFAALIWDAAGFAILDVSNAVRIDITR